MKNGIVVIGTVFMDIKGYPLSRYIPGGRNAGRVVRVHGGVSRNVVEDIANVELRPTFITVVDNDGGGQDVIRRLEEHRVNMQYCRQTPDGMGTWLAVFNNEGDVVASISKRPDPSVIAEILEEEGEEIFDMLFGHYSRIGILDTGAYDMGPLGKKTAVIAEAIGFRWEIFDASVDYIKELLTGPWPAERFLEVPPGCRVEGKDLWIEN